MEKVFVFLAFWASIAIILGAVLFAGEGAPFPLINVEISDVD